MRTNDTGIMETAYEPGRRRFKRVGMTLPIDILDMKKEKKITGLEITDISENGAKIRCNELLSSQVKIYINLPPCYSEDPAKSKGIESSAKVIWSLPIRKREKFIYGVYFLDMKEKDTMLLKGIINYEIEKSEQKAFITAKPKIDIHREPHSCNMYAVDLSIGCESECKYCHFSKLQESAWREKHPLCRDFPIPVDISPIYEMTKLPESVVYLSPSSDPFAPKTRERTHELLEFMLHKGVIFAIVTKHIIPDKTKKLLKKYYRLIEGIGIGVTNLDEERNTLIEPGCPSAGERIEQIRELKSIGCFIGSRMDPLFPLIDDTDENLHRTINSIVKAGAQHIIGTYLFTFGRYRNQLRKIPQLQESLQLLKEKTYPIGGAAFSVPLEYRKKMYDKINEICKSYGIKFNTCGCKDVGLKNTGYPLICRNLDYYKQEGIERLP